MDKTNSKTTIFLKNFSFMIMNMIVDMPIKTFKKLDLSPIINDMKIIIMNKINKNNFFGLYLTTM
tara:strand:+ start:5414 stop:5608 length:195 start_codon:yes stop_codon:yes gene_type:complete